MVLERFDEYLPFFKFKFDFHAFCYFKSPDFENIYPLFIINKVSSTFKSRSSSQASQAKPVICDFVKPEEEENKIINSAKNIPDIDEKHEKENFNDKTTFIQSEFVSSNIINLSRKNISEAGILLLSKSLDFVPTANKIDGAKLKIALEGYRRKFRLYVAF